MNHRSSFALTVLCAFGLFISLLSACGGRFQTMQELDGEGGGGGSGATSTGHAGSTSARAGSTSVGVSGSTSVGVSGASSAGSGGAACDVKCNVPACPAGQLAVFQPGACCATCMPSCAACPVPKCAMGSHLETPPSSCCSICVEDGGASCKKGMQAYAAQRGAFVNKAQYGCARDAECLAIAPSNRCEPGCSYSAVWYGAADWFESNLSAAADMYCASCKQGPIPPCEPPAAPRCVQGQCMPGPI